MDITQLREAQLQYELNSDAEAQATRLRVLLQGSKEGNTRLPKARRLMSRMVGIVQETIDAHKCKGKAGQAFKFRNWLRALPTDVAAVIAIRECIRMCNSHHKIVTVQALANAVGSLYELEVRIRQAERVNPRYMQKIREQLKENGTSDMGHIRRLYNVAIKRVFKELARYDLTRTDIVNIGKFGVDACYQAGLIQQVRTTGTRGALVHYTLNPEVADFLTDYTDVDVQYITAREESKMLCEPDAWEGIVGGGYLSTRRKLVAPLMQYNKLRREVRQEVIQEYTSTSMPLVFKCANTLQSVPFSLHGPTRDAVLRVWKGGGGILGIPNLHGPKKPVFPFEDDIDVKVATEQDVEVFNRWKSHMVMYYSDIRVWKGKARELGALLKHTAAPDAKMWFPVYCDFRGRWYYRGVPNPQGSDAARAILHFHKKKALGKSGVFWLKVHIANSFGYDKERLSKRAEWAEEHWGSIERALDCPEDAPEVFGSDAPWCMFSAAWELREAYRSGNPETYKTGIPVHVDATCSGLQHLSACLLDLIGANCVNITDTGSGPKHDIYAQIAADVSAVMQGHVSEGPQEASERSVMASWALSVGVPRALAKKPVMTYVYSATLRGVSQYIEHYYETEVFQELGVTWPEGVKNQEVCMYLSRLLFQAMEKAVPSAKSMMDWLVNAAETATGRMTWKTPSGFIVQHDYQQYKDKRVKLNCCGVVESLVREYKDGVRKLGMKNAIAPNFVHALDASHITLVCNAAEAVGLEMVGIHDSIGTHACDVQQMGVIIREEFYNMYKNGDVVQNFARDVGYTVPAPPKGTLDLRDVLQSEFFFS